MERRHLKRSLAWLATLEGMKRSQRAAHLSKCLRAALALIPDEQRRDDLFLRLLVLRTEAASLDKLLELRSERREQALARYPQIDRIIAQHDVAYLRRATRTMQQLAK